MTDDSNLKDKVVLVNTDFVKLSHGRAVTNKKRQAKPNQCVMQWFTTKIYHFMVYLLLVFPGLTVSVLHLAALNSGLLFFALLAEVVLGFFL